MPFFWILCRKPVPSLGLLGLRIARQNELISAAQEQTELDELRAIALTTDTVIARTTQFAQHWERDFTAAQRFATIAYGPAIGTAQEMQTKFTEIVRVPSNGYELEAYMHGPYLALNADDRLFFMRTPGTKAVLDKAQALASYEERYTDHVFTIDYTGKADEQNARNLLLPKIADDAKVPFSAATVFQVLAWTIAIDHGINLSDLIFDDFSEVVHNKTQHQNYV